MRRLLLLSPLALLLVAGPLTHPERADQPPDGPPYGPEDALATLAVADGFQVELFAAEPHVQDPVTMAADEHGRVFVAEMPGYPLNTNGTGRIKLLEDADGDGRIDRHTVWADGLVLPTGLMRWRDGLLVVDPPDVLYLTDTDGDGHADTREVVLTGFARSNPQHNANDPEFALDGWIYLANNGPIWWTEDYKDAFGDRGTEIRFPAHPDGPRLPRNAANRNVRFRPGAEPALEALSSSSQFGHTFDAWGRHFLNDNTHPIVHEVVAARYLERAPDLPVRRATHDVPAYGVPPAVFPITQNPEHQLLTDRGVTTSAAGLTWYLGGRFPEPYSRVTFTAEPVHNLVHAAVVEPDGATFRAERLFADREFLASTDSWFRPVNFSVGPDGALYVVDYYRQIVEHPEWMDEATRRSDDLWNGTERGRIWRVTPVGTPAADWVGRLDLADADAERLVQTLADANAWWRLNAQRLLLDRRPPDAVPPLTAMAARGSTAEARLHALHTLDALGHLSDDLIRLALADASPGVREHAVRFAEGRLAGAPALADALLALTDDPDPRVRFQLLLTLGDLTTKPAREARQTLLFRAIDDPWMQIAALSAREPGDADRLAEAVRRLAGRDTEGRRTYFERLGHLAGAQGDARGVRRALDRTLNHALGDGDPWWRAAVLRGLAAGLRSRPTTTAADLLGDTALADAFFDAPDGDLSRAILDLLHVATPPDPAIARRALALATSADERPARRADALAVVSLVDAMPFRDVLRALVGPNEDPGVQAAAVRALGTLNDGSTADFLLAQWPSLTGTAREAALDALMQTAERQARLLDAIAQGRVHASALGWGRRVRLMRDTDEPLRSQARALLREDRSAREAVVERYRPVLALAGDAEAGQTVFDQACAACHTRGGRGVAFGPDLGTVRHWPAEALLTKILVPARSIADGYAFWTVERANGEQVGGILAAETATSLTLRLPGGTETTVPRRDVVAMEAAPTSAMPSGLEAQISPEAMADLLAFLRTSE